MVKEIQQWAWTYQWFMLLYSRSQIILQLKTNFRKEQKNHISSVQSLSLVRLFATPWSADTSLLCPSLSRRACSNSHPLSRWCHPTLSSSVIPFSCLHSFPASGAFLMGWLFTSGGQANFASASASVLWMNIQDWFPLGLTGLISLQSKGLSRVFSNTTVQSITSSVLSFLYGPTLTSIHDYWKNHSFNYMELCWQSNVSSF